MSFSPSPLQVIIRLAVGLVEQHERSLRQTASPITSPNRTLKTGLEQLSVLCLRGGILPPWHHKEVVEWLHLPLDQWAGDIGMQSSEAGLTDSLLFAGVPTDLTYELVARLGDGHTSLELQDLPFKKIMQYCRDQQLSEQYVRARQFLVENRCLPNGTHIIGQNLDWDDDVSRALIECYELIPLRCRVRRDDQHDWVAFCPRCGWVLEWHRSRYTEQASCYSDLCGSLVERIHQPSQWAKYQPEMMRTTRGIQRFIAAPEIALLKLKADLESLGGICHLWPHFDNYDLLVELPALDRRIAIDMKDYTSPVYLAEALDSFQRYPAWDECYYVFPDYRKRGDYLKQFKTAWRRRCKANLSLNTIGINFAADFLKYVRQQLGGQQ